MGEKVSCPDHMLCLHGLGMRLVEKHLPATVLGCKKKALVSTWLTIFLLTRLDLVGSPVLAMKAVST